MNDRHYDVLMVQSMRVIECQHAIGIKKMSQRMQANDRVTFNDERVIEL
jgi:hypothetical protein